MNIKKIVARVNTVVEHGEVILNINGNEVEFKIEEQQDNDFRIYIDKNDYDENKLNLKFEFTSDFNCSNELQIIDEHFVKDIYEFYRKTGETNDGSYYAH